MIFKKGEWEHLGGFYIAKFSQVLLSVMMPFMIVYFRDIGLTFTQIATVFTVFGIFTFLFEIPTGAIADGYSRKLSVLIGSFASFICLFFMMFTTNFYMILIFWSLAGISQTFVSGADSSWVISNLKHKKKKKLEQEYFIKLQVIVTTGAVLAPLLGILLLNHFNYSILWLVFATGFLLEGILLVFIPEHYKPKKTSLLKAIQNVIKQAKKGFAHVKKNKNLIYFFIAMTFFLFTGLGDEGWEPLFVELGGPVANLGYLYSLTALACVGIPFLIRKFSGWKIKHVLIVSELINMGILLSVLLFNKGMFWYILIPYALFWMTDAFNRPLKQQFLHNHLTENIRATVMSIHSMLFFLIASIVTMIGGVLLDILPIKWVIAAGSIFVLGSIYFYNKIQD